MRAEFDGAFARPPRRPETDLEDVIALRLGDESCLLRLVDIAGLIADPLLTVLPTPVPALLGIIGNRGSVVAAYDLGILRGRPSTSPRWLAISAAEPSVGVSFEHFDGYRRIHRDSSQAGRPIEMRDVIEAIRAFGPTKALTHSRSSDRETES
jgi:chemotaxis signal transduction protein